MWLSWRRCARRVRQLVKRFLRRVLARAVAQFHHIDAVAGLHLTRGQRHEEDALAREDAVAGQVVDGALLVAHLALLGQLQQHVVADFDLRAQRQRHKVDAFGGDVLGEVAFLYVKAAGLGLRNGFPSKQRNLAVPFAGVRVLGHTMVRFDGDRAVDYSFARALAFGNACGAHGAMRGAFGVRAIHATLFHNVDLVVCRLARGAIRFAGSASVRLLHILVAVLRHKSPNKPSE